MALCCEYSWNRRFVTVITTALGDRKLRQGQNVIRNANSDFWINPDSDQDVCRIGPKMLWIHSLVDVFAKHRKNRPVVVWEMLINLLKSPIPHADPDKHQKFITSRESPLVHAYHVWSTSVSAFVSHPAHKTTK